MLAADVTSPSPTAATEVAEDEPEVPRQECHTGVHDEVQVDVAVGMVLEGDTETAAKVGDGPPDAADPADVELTEEEGTEVAEGEPEVPRQECSVGHFNMLAELPIPTMLVESYTTTTAPSCLSQFEILGNTTHTHTHPFNGPFSGTTQVGRYQKGKTNLDFTEARDSEWQWHQLGHMQVCTLLQTDNHASTSPLTFLQAGCPS